MILKREIWVFNTAGYSVFNNTAGGGLAFDSSSGLIYVVGSSSIGMKIWLSGV